MKKPKGTGKNVLGLDLKKSEGETKIDSPPSPFTFVETTEKEKNIYDSEGNVIETTNIGKEHKEFEYVQTGLKEGTITIIDQYIEIAMKNGKKFEELPVILRRDILNYITAKIKTGEMKEGDEYEQDFRKALDINGW